MSDPDKKSLRDRLRELRDNTAKAVQYVKGVFQFDAFASFKSENTEIDFPVDLAEDTLWATQAQMAELFGVTRPNITMHLQNLFHSGALDEAGVSKKSLHTAADGKAYETTFYNLDATLSVGFKVNSKRAVGFQKWAIEVLKGYIRDGYALNGARLNRDPAALLSLAQEVRAIRTSEKNLYSQVRETFAQCAIDYDKDDPTARVFFATSQDIFHYAASEKTATQIILDRADASKPNMGLTGLGNRAPTVADIKVAKNYCEQSELRKMELIGEAWLLYAEGMAMQGKQVSMARLLSKLRELVVLNEFPVFPGYQSGLPSRDKADKHARAQYDLFKSQARLDSPQN